MSRALITIDFINEFIHPDGLITPQGMGDFCETYGTIGHVRELIDAFRASREEIIWVHLGFHENYDNCSTRSPRFRSAPSAGILREDTWSTEFIEELGYDVREKTITKTRVSAFYNTDLESYLREQGIDEIVVAGVATDLAVSSITRDAHDRDILVTVAHDACGTISREHHDAALIAIAKLASVRDTADIIHNS
jgi:nicotinamidase-related amidase